MAEKKVWAQRSYRVAIRRQSLSLPNAFSMRCRCLYSILSKGNLSFLLFRGGMQTVTDGKKRLEESIKRHLSGRNLERALTGLERLGEMEKQP